MTERRGKKRPSTRKIYYADGYLTGYSIGWLAALVSRHPQTLRDMETKGILPRPVFETDSSGLRFYTAAELIGYSNIMANNPARPGPGGCNWKDLQSRFHSFKQKLLADIKAKNQKALIASLPNEARLMESMCVSHDKDFKAMAQKIIK